MRTRGIARPQLLFPILFGCLAELLEPTAACGATAYYVTATDVYVRSHAQGYAMGRLYTGDRMDIVRIDSNGWAFGFAKGHVNRCVWAQYRDQHGNIHFRTHGTQVSDHGCKVRKIPTEEFTNGTIWGDSDGVYHSLAGSTDMWDNWLWGRGRGAERYRGQAPAGSLWKIRYTTKDGRGVMARPCKWTGDWSTTRCKSDWVFIERLSL